MTMWRRVACWISKATGGQAHACAREPRTHSAHTQIRNTLPVLFYETVLWIKMLIQSHYSRRRTNRNFICCR